LKTIALGSKSACHDSANEANVGYPACKDTMDRHRHAIIFVSLLEEVWLQVFTTSCKRASFDKACPLSRRRRSLMFAHTWTPLRWFVPNHNE